MLIDLLDKALTELDDSGHPESSTPHNFALLEQSLEDQLAQGNKAFEDAKTEKTDLSTAFEAENADFAQVERRVWQPWWHLWLKVNAVAHKWP